MKKVFTLLLSIISITASAKVTLSPLFTDNAVLQQKCLAPIWGKAKPYSKVTIVTSWNNHHYSTQAGSDGHWKTRVRTPKAGGPYQISISDGEPIVLHNILIGEVWLCSGQSNMEMPMQGWSVKMNSEEISNSSNYPRIRLLHVKHAISPSPIDSFTAVGDGWLNCSPETVKDFSATGYFFGVNIFKSQNVPVGLIMTCWGGTTAEAWTSPQSLEYMPCFSEQIKDNKMADCHPDTYLKHLQKARSIRQDSINISEQKYIGNNGQYIFLDESYNDANWTKVKQPGLIEDKEIANFDGLMWLRYKFDIPATMEKQDLVLKLGKVDDNDTTYFNGVQIGHTKGCSRQRLYQISKQLIKKGTNTISIKVEDTGGLAGIYGVDSILLSTVDGKEKINLSGIWKLKPTTNYKKFPERLNALTNPNTPAVLYNAMIHPLIPYSIRGAVWYQGEANADRPYQYRELLPLTVQSWRKEWGIQFPFYIVQLANYMTRKEKPTESNWATLRESQALVSRILPNSGLMVNIDLGEANDIHPTTKKEVGRRLALLARANTYHENIEYSGPVFHSYKIVGNKIIITFTHAQGLHAIDGKPLQGFAIAGPDHIFHYANAVITGTKIEVSSPYVTYPISVRYAWADNPPCNLYNRDGLPACPFRTDDWRDINAQ